MWNFKPSATPLILGVVVLLAASRLLCPTAAAQSIEPASGYEEIADSLRTAIQHEIDDKQLGAISIAIVDDQKIVWAEGFGTANPTTGTPATAESIINGTSFSGNWNGP